VHLIVCKHSTALRALAIADHKTRFYAPEEVGEDITAFTMGGGAGAGGGQRVNALVAKGVKAFGYGGILVTLFAYTTQQRLSHFVILQSQN
jgi:hypothetical protein